MSQVVIAIPAFEPEQRLVELVRRLKSDFRDIVVVDDGSHTAGDVFEDLRTIEGVVVLSHDTNRGKGAALKTAFEEILRRFPDAVGAVTADADGQHLPEDIVRIAQSLTHHPDRLTLGVRTFGKDIPFRSRLGNLWTVIEFRLLTGHHVRDTQTGLRGIPLAFLPLLLNIPGDRYDYEIRMLANTVLRSNSLIQVPIATVYENGNGTSHFKPLADTISTQCALFVEALTARFGWRSRASR